ncbi:JAB1/Mov34/MPN/PAD-1 ubiquitin protease-domain-containing protein [Echria macrotheca]|uniref:COP9 signalosome complex subunit 5 n=1 Tax=Echria macrotheca TaxID=438768 RepID=A0AAJ0B7H9_9PEZI|nr:JAB1/Mov34/MPN/PAD-1 ubiquitin protease-domain-containing protein [Echria macrotheca]
MELPATDRLADPQRDALYNYDAEAQRTINSQKPWNKNVQYFKSVRVSAVALIKMVMHARSGGSIEVMGLMQGYVDGTAIVVTDAFRLPVEGTETRVNAQDDANEYLVEYLRLCREDGDGGRQENVVGWYHSHPGYGCWLSGIDVNTQSMQQSFNDPFVAVVIDPDRTVSANKVEIGAFRTYPESYKPAGDASGGGGGGDGNVPLYKAEDFGAHANRYYSLEVEHFRSSLDSRLLELLWNKYWVQTLAQNPLLTNRDFASAQMLDLGTRVQDTANQMRQSGRSGGGTAATGPAAHVLGSGGGPGTPASRAIDRSMDKLVRDLNQVAAKEKAGLAAAAVKARIFLGEDIEPSA